MFVILVLYPTKLDFNRYLPAGRLLIVNAPFAFVSAPVTNELSTDLYMATEAYSRGCLLNESMSDPETE
jgi:hypothetical protein